MRIACADGSFGGNSLLLKGAGEGMSFYLKPDFSKIDGSVIVAAMNQAFFTLSTVWAEWLFSEVT